jgi:hypothetical protein
MARHGKTLPVRRTPGMDDSLLIRSAESLGRAIGSLQRQLDGASKRLSAGVDTLRDNLNNGSGPARQPAGTRSAKAGSPKAKSARGAKRGASKQRAAPAGTAARPAKTKSAAAKRPRAARAAASHK